MIKKEKKYVFPGFSKNPVISEDRLEAVVWFGGRRGKRTTLVREKNRKVDLKRHGKEWCQRGPSRKKRVDRREKCNCTRCKSLLKKASGEGG